MINSWHIVLGRAECIVGSEAVLSKERQVEREDWLARSINKKRSVTANYRIRDASLKSEWFRQLYHFIPSPFLLLFLEKSTLLRNIQEDWYSTFDLPLGTRIATKKSL